MILHAQNDLNFLTLKSEITDTTYKVSLEHLRINLFAIVSS